MRLASTLAVLLTVACSDSGGTAACDQALETCGVGGGAGSGGSGGSAGSDVGTDADGDVVVDVTWLQEHLGDDGVQVVDARRGASSHVPGAVPVDPQALVDADAPVDGQIAPPSAAEMLLASAGLRPDTTLVVYGVPPEYNPGRVFWAFAYYGHRQVRYLDGGFDAWVAAGGEEATGPASESGPTGYAIPGVDDSLRVTGDWVLDQLGDPPYDAVPIQIVDARSLGEYEAGHIPTAISVDWTRNLVDGAFKPEPELSSPYADLDPAVTTITYCVTGWRASMAWLSLTKLGFEDVRLYDGSWSEWGADARFPVEMP